ncbi:MAG TPA: hypothetical protein VF816_10485 [Rhodocyclaceae bacterium]
MAALAVFATWLLVTIWRYVTIQSRKGLLEQEQNILGKSGRAEYRGLMAVVVPRVPSSLALFTVLAIVVLLGLAKLLGYL